jgi:hypothetical protein
MNAWRVSTPLLLTVAAAAGCDGAATAGGRDAAQRTSAPSATANETAASSAVPAVGARSAAPLRRDASGTIEATFDDLKFPMEKTDDFAESMLTDRVKELFGERIRIRGYMFPTLRKKGLKQFVLVRDNMECCFGPGAALFDCIVVNMVGGATAEYSIRPLAVEGNFRFEALSGPDGRPLAIFQLAGEAVE